MVRLIEKGELRTYYATFPMQKDEDGGIPINIFTEKQHEDTDGLMKRVPKIRTEDAKAIDRYIENNEKIIDKFIRERIEAGDFAEIEGRAERLNFDKRFPDRKRPDLFRKFFAAR
jgi:hypothetical protein